ncbi:unnamed protein product [Lactuca saligna]|uniref:Uncharacterized protein n=1 Tax=Lactuca saligna TaxID=75948 RepID=A0AA35UZR8_LACSI|nr:unnamed protein product [Lactuca saligna]
MNCKYAILKLKGGASIWFQDLKRRRACEGMMKISSLESLIYKIKIRYVPAHHRITNYLKFSKSWLSKLDVIDLDESLGETVVIEVHTIVKESSIVTVEEYDVIKNAREDEEVLENTFIYKTALWYELENNIDKMSLPKAENEIKETGVDDFDPIYDIEDEEEMFDEEIGKVIMKAVNVADVDESVKYFILIYDTDWEEEFC